MKGRSTNSPAHIEGQRPLRSTPARPYFQPETRVNGGISTTLTPLQQLLMHVPVFAGLIRNDVDSGKLRPFRHDAE